LNFCFVERLFLVGGLILLPAGARLLPLPRLILHRGLTRLFVLLGWIRLVLLCHKTFLLTYQQALLRARSTMLIQIRLEQGGEGCLGIAQSDGRP
jgi:hypothetical protein